MKDAIPRAKVTSELQDGFGSMTTGKTVVTLPVQDWSRIVALATADDPPPDRTGRSRR